MSKRILSFILIMCSMLLFAGCGKTKTLTAEEFADTLRTPKTAEAFSPAREPITAEEFLSRMEEMQYIPMYNQNEEGITRIFGMGSFGQAGFVVFPDEEAAKSEYQAFLESLITSYEKAEMPQLVGAPILVNETAEDHEKLLIQSEYIYLNCSRVGNTVFTVNVAADVDEWAEKFEGAFRENGY